jgi:hypothetical protein
VRRFQASESQPVAKACRLPRLSLFCWRLLHFLSPCTMQVSRPLLAKPVNSSMGVANVLRFRSPHGVDCASGRIRPSLSMVNFGEA